MEGDHKEELELARSFFPLMEGTDVFAIWLAPIIAEYSWPFTSLSDPITPTGWEPVLTWQPLEKIAKLRWHLIEVTFSLSLFTPQAESTIYALFESHVCGLQNAGLNK